MFNDDFMRSFLAGEVGIVEIGQQVRPENMLSHKHQDIKKSLVSKEAEMPDLNQGTEDIKFVHLEMMKSDATRQDEPKSGLFKGLKERAEGTDKNKKLAKFIVLGDQSKPSDVHSYHMDRFNVMSLTIKYGDTTELVVFKADSYDQKQALEVIGAVVDQLRAKDWMAENDPELIDIEKYKEVPHDLGGAKVSSHVGTGTKTGTPKTSANPYGDIYGRTGCGFNNEKWRQQQAARKKQEDLEKKMRWTPTKIEREGDPPAVQMLNLMKKKIAQIATGDYEYELPEVKDDVESDDDDKDATVKDCQTCTHSTAYGYKNSSNENCKVCADHNKYEYGEEDDDDAYNYAGVPM